MLALTWKWDSRGLSLDVEGVNRVGGPMVEYEVHRVLGLYRLLADASPDIYGARDFASSFGIPGSDPDADGFSIEEFERLGDLLRKALEAADAGSWNDVIKAFGEAKAAGMWDPSSITISLERGESSKRPALRLRPKTLVCALWLQFALDLTEGRRLRRCKNCGSYFEFGKGTGRRKTAMYCSDKCRWTAHYKAKKENLR